MIEVDVSEALPKAISELPNQIIRLVHDVVTKEIDEPEKATDVALTALAVALVSFADACTVTRESLLEGVAGFFDRLERLGKAS